MTSVYLETTIPSYLAAEPSRDLIVAAHQQITHQWWNNARERFDLFVSEAVTTEIRAGNAAAVARRNRIVEGLPILAYNADVHDLVREYARRLGLVGRAQSDLPHFAFAVAYELDYLVTWNCSHIANGEVIRRLFAANSDLGRFTPLIVTPEEIFPVSESESP